MTFLQLKTWLCTMLLLHSTCGISILDSRNNSTDDLIPNSEKLGTVLGVRNLQGMPLVIFRCAENPKSKSVGASTVQKGKNARKVDDIDAYAENCHTVGFGGWCQSMLMISDDFRAT